MANLDIALSRRVFTGALIASAACCQAPSAAAKITNLTAEGAVNNPYGIRVGPDGFLYICEIGNHRISKLDLKSRHLTTVLEGQKEPYDLRFHRKGSDRKEVLYFVDMPAHQVRSFNLQSREVAVVAGTGTPGFAGDGGPATQAQFRQPHSIAFDSQGRLLICDIGNHRIRMVDLSSGIITTFAGTGEPGKTRDGAPRQGTPLHGPRAIDFDRHGRLLLVLREGNRVYSLDPKTDTYRHVAGNGEKGYTGDGGDARLATLSGPKAIACAPDGSVLIADTESHTIRRISANGVIATVVGTGTRGDGPEGDPRKCMLSRPHGLFVDKTGTVYIGDSEAHRIRKVSAI